MNGKLGRRNIARAVLSVDKFKVKKNADKPQQMVWYLLPKGWGLRGQNSHPG
jgi:hypothetical protein